MKKIMFNDKYGLTQAVLDGRKTMTRRIVPEKTLKGAEAYVQKIHGTGHDYLDYLLEHAHYKVGEVLAVAQNLRDMGYDAHAKAWRRGQIWGLDHTPAWTNKMFVSAWECIHQIRITNIKVERLQDISDEDVFKEGFSSECVNNGWGNYAYHKEAVLVYYDSLGRTREIGSRYPKEAFAALIDKVSGKGTWEINPWVFVYEFELVN